MPVSDSYVAIVNIIRSKSTEYDGFVFVGTLPDFVYADENREGLTTLDAWLNSSSMLSWAEIGSFYRQYGVSFNGQVFGIPLSGSGYFMVLSNIKLKNSTTGMICSKHLGEVFQIHGRNFSKRPNFFTTKILMVIMFLVIQNSSVSKYIRLWSVYDSYRGHSRRDKTNTSHANLFFCVSSISAVPRNETRVLF